MIYFLQTCNYTPAAIASNISWHARRRRNTSRSIKHATINLSRCFIVYG